MHACILHELFGGCVWTGVTARWLYKQWSDYNRRTLSVWLCDRWYVGMVVLTSVILQCLCRGMSDYMSKPVIRAALNQMVDKWTAPEMVKYMWGDSNVGFPTGTGYMAWSGTGTHVVWRDNKFCSRRIPASSTPQLFGRGKKFSNLWLLIQIITLSWKHSHWLWNTILR